MNRDPKQVLTEWLVLSAQGGSEASFRELHALWNADLWRLIRSRVDKFEVVDEIANDVWLAISRGLHRLDDPACFPRWAFTIVERRSADWIRRQTRMRKRELAVVDEVDRLGPAELTSTDVPDEVLRLRAAIARLSTPQRDLVNLYYGHERSLAEIAEILAIPAGTIKSRLFAVRETLKQMLERKST